MPHSTVFNVSSALIVHILVRFEVFIPSSKHIYAGLTNPVEQSSSSEHCRSTSQEIPPVSWFMEGECSLPFPQDPATGRYNEKLPQLAPSHPIRLVNLEGRPCSRL